MSVYFILLCGLIALAAAYIYAKRVKAVSITTDDAEITDKLKMISDAISEGAMAFLSREYKVVFMFCVAFCFLILFSLNETHSNIHEGLYIAVAFIAGALISSVSAFLGMKIATIGNVRTAVKAKEGISSAFKVSYETGAVMGFGLSGLAVLGMLTIYLLFGNFITDTELLMEVITGFGLGASSVALFGRVGGGIFTKAADVGADLVGKVEQGIPEDDPRNPATIADNVGDNVGDIAGMGADLFGSCAEATCAALVIGATAVAVRDSQSALLYPLLISAVSIPVCLMTAFFARLKNDSKTAEPVLKKQLVLSTILMTIAIYFTTKFAMVETFTIGGQIITKGGVLASVILGLWGGLAIGFITEYYTSHAYSPVRKIAKASETGAATNLIYGLSIGYSSAVIPVLVIALTVYISWTFAGRYGIAMSAIGMISTISIGLTIDAYGPVADNAGGIAEMCGMGEEVRNRTDTLDAAGNTTAAIGKGFAIGSALLTALALFVAFLTRANIEVLDMLTPGVFAGMLIGGVLPFLFTAQTMLAVGDAAFAMIEEVRRQFKTMPGILEGTTKPDYKRCVDISTSAALKKMIAPGALVLFTPIVVGIVLGIQPLAGLLAGSLVSGLVLALSASNSGGAWDNAKKYIESGACGGKGTEAHKASIVGDTVGDPLKDTSGPSLNILMKLMAIVSLVFVDFIEIAHDVFANWVFNFFGG